MSNLERLQLSRNQLEGVLNGPELLQPLEKLEVIGLGGNKLTGTLPSEIASMPSMIFLNIPANKFTGTIPSSWDTESRLKHVSFATNQLTGTIPAGLSGIESLKNLYLFDNNLRGSVGPSVCVGDDSTTMATYNGMNMTIDCELVGCACCGCNGVTPISDLIDVFVESSTTNDNGVSLFTPVADEAVIDDTNDESSISQALANMVNNTSTNTTAEEEAVSIPETEVEDVGTMEPSNTESFATMNGSSTIAPASFTPISDTAMENTITILNGDPSVLENSEDFGCQSIDIGFPCYTSGWSIDFELSNRRCGGSTPPPPVTELYDIVALYQFDGDIEAPPGANVGSTKSLSDALFWASSCGLVDCDGVIANGQVYYRNTYPQEFSNLANPWWPVPPGTMLQMQWIRTDDAGMAVVIAESRPFLIANRCR